MTKHNIEIEDLPEGWDAVAYRVPKIGESFISIDGDLVTNNIGQSSSRLIVQRSKLRRIALESTDEDNLKYTSGFYANQVFGNGVHVADQPKIWREVKETHIPLTKEEPKLSLSVEECRNVRSLIKDFENLGWFVNPARSLLLQKITEFIKDK